VILGIGVAADRLRALERRAGLDRTVARDHPRRLGLGERLAQRLQPAGRQGAAGVGGGDHGVGGRGDPRVAPLGDVRPGRLMHDEPSLTHGPSAQDRDGRVARAAVDDDQLVVAAQLSDDLLEEPRDGVLLVEHGRDDRHRRPVAQPRSRPAGSGGEVLHQRRSGGRRAAVGDPREHGGAPPGWPWAVAVDEHRAQAACLQRQRGAQLGPGRVRGHQQHVGVDLPRGAPEGRRRPVELHARRVLQRGAPGGSGEQHAEGAPHDVRGQRPQPRRGRWHAQRPGRRRRRAHALRSADTPSFVQIADQTSAVTSGERPAR
jgi:hypothetical protein